MRHALTIAPAAPQDTPVVHALLNDAAAWLAARRIDQWPYPFPEHLVRAFIDRNGTYIARYGNDPVGTLAVYWEDRTFWGAQPPDAGYVHALAVDSRARGHELGARLLDWAARLAATRDRTWLRLDCGTDNTPLRRYYERLGSSTSATSWSPSPEPDQQQGHGAAAFTSAKPSRSASAASGSATARSPSRDRRIGLPDQRPPHCPYSR